MMPGITIRPSASISCFAPVRLPTSVMKPSRMPTSAVRIGRPDPSITVPPFTIVSNAIALPFARPAGVDALARPADVLQLAVGRKREPSAVAADAAHLVAPERRVRVRRAAVDLHGPGTQRARHAHGAARVAAPHVAVEAILR